MPLSCALEDGRIGTVYGCRIAHGLLHGLRVPGESRNSEKADAERDQERGTPLDQPIPWMDVERLGTANEAARRLAGENSPSHYEPAARRTPNGSRDCVPSDVERRNRRRVRRSHLHKSNLGPQASGNERSVRSDAYWSWPFPVGPCPPEVLSPLLLPSSQTPLHAISIRTLQSSLAKGQ